MSADLGEYKGLPIAGHALSLKGTGDGLSKAMSIAPTDLDPGQEIDLLVRAKAGNVMHRVDDIDAPSSWTIEQSLMAQTITIVSREFADEKIAAQRYAEVKLKEADLAKKGVPPLAPHMGLDKGPRVVSDGNGVVLTDAEVAERRGRLADVNGPDPAVVSWLNDTVDVLKPKIKKHVGRQFLEQAMAIERQGEDRGTVLNLLEKRIGELS